MLNLPEDEVVDKLTVKVSEYDILNRISVSSSIILKFLFAFVKLSKFNWFRLVTFNAFY